MAIFFYPRNPKNHEQTRSQAKVAAYSFKTKFTLKILPVCIVKKPMYSYKNTTCY